MKIINLLRSTFFLTTLLGLSCCHVTEKTSRENTIANGTHKDKLIQKPYVTNRITQDTTFKLYHLEHDTLFIGKQYPPEGFKMKSNTSTYFFYQQESNESKAKVESCFRPDRLEILIQNRSSLFLNVYLDQAGIVQEVEIKINDRDKIYISEEEIKCICNNLKGLKIPIPSELSHFPFVKMSQSIRFKNFISPTR